ncbi:MAG: VWA domain-containing protein [Flavobacteriales bacterium]
MSRPVTYRIGTIVTITLIVEVLAWVLMLGAWWLLDREVPAFRFERSWVLRAMFIGPVMVILFLLDLGWRGRALLRFAGPNTVLRMVPGISSTRTLLRFLLLRHGLSFVVVAMAGPQYGTRYEEVRAKGIDLVVAMDVSNSMLSEDLPPSRLEVAKRSLSQLIDRMQGDRLGIVVFAGDAFVQLPITTDRSAAKMFLSTIGPSSVGTQGTAIGAAIELAQESFDPESPASKSIIVITDGENHEDDAEGAARAAFKEGIVVHAVGMGTPQGGPIPVRRNGQVIGFKKDGNGSTVVSRLDEDMLRRIAAAGNGEFERATSRSAGIDRIVEGLKRMDRTETGSYRYAAYEDRYQYPLGLGLMCIIAGMCFGERSHQRKRILAGS